MGEKRKKRDGCGCAIATIGVLVLLVLLTLYVLSSAEAASRVREGKMRPDEFSIIYAPLVWTMKHSRLARDGLGTYWDWYMGKNRD